MLDERHQWPYWAEGDSHLLIDNRGVNRERTDEIARRLVSLPSDVDALVIQGGINDVVQGHTPEAAAAELRSMVTRSKQIAPVVALADVLPWNRGYPEHDQAIRTLNALIHEIAESERVLLLPFFATLEDSRTPGRMRGVWTSDGNHPSVEGHRRLGELVAGVLSVQLCPDFSRGNCGSPEAREL